MDSASALCKPQVVYIPLLIMSTILGAVVLNSQEHKIDSLPPPVNDEATTSLADDEASARKKAASNPFYLLLINTYSAVVIFVVHLISLESLVSIGLSVGLTIYAYDLTKGSHTFDGSIMSWVLLSFAVITPIGAELQMAFTRRELALLQTATIRSAFSELYTAHAIWDWDFKPGNEVESGRTKSKVNWLEHSDNACVEILAICNDITR
jgi:hypothetical protein